MGASKELNPSTLKFEPYAGNMDILKCTYPINVLEINSIARSILMGKISYVLPDNDMKWIREFNDISSTQPEILDNDNYAFNYLVLKIMLIGFSEDTAIDIVKRYFKYKKDGFPVLSISKVLKSVNKIIDGKAFWITNKIIEFDKLETAFVTKVLKNRIQTGFSFNYKIFEHEYISICEKSFTRENYLINSVKTYPIKKIKNLQEQLPYIFQSYDEVMTSIINNVIQTKFPSLFQGNRALIKLLSDMTNTLKITISTW